MMTLEQIQENLKDKNLTVVANSIGGVTSAYLSAIRNGTRINPSYEMLRKISNYLESDNA